MKYVALAAMVVMAVAYFVVIIRNGEGWAQEAERKVTEDDR